MKHYEESPKKYETRTDPQSIMRRELVAEAQKRVDEKTSKDLRSRGIPEKIIEDVISYAHKKNTSIVFKQGEKGFVSTITVYQDDPTGHTPPSPLYMVDVPFNKQHSSDAAIREWSNPDKAPKDQQVAIDSLTQVLLDDTSNRSE